VSTDEFDAIEEILTTRIRVSVNAARERLRIPPRNYSGVPVGAPTERTT
jgi:hypothetical protein